MKHEIGRSAHQLRRGVLLAAALITMGGAASTLALAQAPPVKEEQKKKQGQPPPAKSNVQVPPKGPPPVINRAPPPQKQVNPPPRDIPAKRQAQPDVQRPPIAPRRDLPATQGRQTGSDSLQKGPPVNRDSPQRPFVPNKQALPKGTPAQDGAGQQGGSNFPRTGSPPGTRTDVPKAETDRGRGPLLPKGAETGVPPASGGKQIGKGLPAGKAPAGGTLPPAAGGGTATGVQKGTPVGTNGSPPAFGGPPPGTKSGGAPSTAGTDRGGTQRTNLPPAAGGGPAAGGAPANGLVPPVQGKAGAIPVITPGATAKGTPSGPRRIDEVRRNRVSTKGPGGQTTIQEPGNRTIVKQDNRVFITRNETTAIQKFAPGARTNRRRDGIVETVYARPDGSRIYSEVDSQGRLIRRYRQDPGGRQHVLVDNRRFWRNVGVGVAVGVVAAAAIVALAPPVVAVPRQKYVVEYVNASDDDIYEALTAPPVERLERTYSLEEIRYSEPLRARVRRVDLDNITFETGSFEVGDDQRPKLERIARGISRAIEANPNEVFMIEGHTDAVGAPEDNLSLSDRRAEAVAQILTQYFNVPIENLVTQGYGEQHMKVPTQGPERANRRVAVRRITPLLSQGEEGR
ncbi:MAG: OmpA family protein [Hyphomicrobiaceae bacterium]|nr:OmpA family protein [Hyphomicrobiaceae bacterium]